MPLVSQQEDACTGLVISDMKESNDELLPDPCPLNLSSPSEKLEHLENLLFEYVKGREE